MPRERDVGLDTEALTNIDAAWRRACRDDALARRLPEPPLGSGLPAALVAAAVQGPEGYADSVSLEATALVHEDVAFDGAVRQLFLLGEVVAKTVPPDRAPGLVRSLRLGSEVIGRSYIGSAEAAARTDELTTLPNQRVFDDDIDGAVKRVKTVGGRFAVAAIDLDGLKVANDEFGGHAAGDHYIRRFGAQLVGMARPVEGRAYRVHGDEFFVIFRERDRMAAEALLTEMRKRADVAPFSYGVATCPDDSNDVDELIRVADKERLYTMKQSRPRRADEARAWLGSPHWDFGDAGRSPARQRRGGLLTRPVRRAFDTIEHVCAWAALTRRTHGF